MKNRKQKSQKKSAAPSAFSSEKAEGLRESTMEIMSKFGDVADWCVENRRFPESKANRKHATLIQNFENMCKDGKIDELPAFSKILCHVVKGYLFAPFALEPDAGNYKESAINGVPFEYLERIPEVQEKFSSILSLIDELIGDIHEGFKSLELEAAV